MSKPYNLIKATNNEYEAFGNNLKCLLRKNNITNKELGYALNLSDQTISDYLNWVDFNIGKQPFWVPMLKLIKFLEQNTSNFNIYDLITKRYEHTLNINTIKLDNKPRLKSYKIKFDNLNNEYNTLLKKYNNDLTNYENTLKTNKKLNLELSNALEKIQILQNRLNDLEYKVKILDKKRISLTNQNQKLKLLLR